MAVNLPSLSSSGFISDPAVKLDKLLSYFFVADFSQSNQHKGRVASLPYLVKNYGDQPNILVDRIQTTVENMLGAYFESVQVLVTEEDPLTVKPEYNVRLEGSVTHNGKKYDIARLLNVSNSTLMSVSELQIK